MEQRIVCAANLFVTVGHEFIVLGVRHYDPIMVDMIKLMPPGTYEKRQGFVDNKGNFLTREEAWIVAEKAGQIMRRVGGDGARLFSENLY